MNRIVAGITSLEQHNQALIETPNRYRPPACPHCGIETVWAHGCYHRKADLCNRGEANLNPVAIPRYCCSACKRTCSRLPECIAPHRWYNWFLQQVGLRAARGQTEVTTPSHYPTPARRTEERWKRWLEEGTALFRCSLTSRFPEFGRAADDAAFWLEVFDTLGLSTAMAWLDREMVVP